MHTKIQMIDRTGRHLSAIEHFDTRPEGITSLGTGRLQTSPSLATNEAEGSLCGLSKTIPLRLEEINLVLSHLDFIFLLGLDRTETNRGMSPFFLLLNSALTLDRTEGPGSLVHCVVKSVESAVLLLEVPGGGGF